MADAAKASAPAAESPTSTPAPAAPAAADLAKARTDGQVEGRTQERERILGILQLRRPGHEALIHACIEDPACTPADAALRILGAEEQLAKGQLDARKADEAKLDKPSASPTNEEPSADGAVARRILQNYRAATAPAGR